MGDKPMKSLLPSLWGRDEAADSFRSLRREVDKVFQDFGKLPAVFSGDGGGVPAINVSETAESVEVTAELPGVTEEDVEITLSDQMLTIKGEKKFEKEETEKDFHLVERSYGSFRRTVALPFAAEADKVDASFDKGVLKIHLPRPAEI
ncbi:MAG: Hsp20/alpha crystallin family protein, partial [Hyphomicrobiales bacterium]|nr:Hsp20/alpha crystallin family protein [Hyphomicrobiales bacterium]